jgi:SAM-dependent methyltransferase
VRALRRVDVPDARRLAVPELRLQDRLLRLVMPDSSSGPSEGRAGAVAERVDAWTSDLLARHAASLSRHELLKCIRALSARYVEARQEISTKAPADTAGKRAAFAAFFAPIHFFTVRAIVSSLPGTTDVTTLVDLGCGTGAASAAWALDTGARVTGVDRTGWTIDEARWNWRALGVQGRAERGDLVASADALARRLDVRSARSTAVLLAWAVNELAPPTRARLLAAIEAMASRGAMVLVIEPIARRVSPWWHEWLSALAPLGARDADWKVPAALPPPLAALDEAAGFRREVLTARTLLVPWA